MVKDICNNNDSNNFKGTVSRELRLDIVIYFYQKLYSRANVAHHKIKFFFLLKRSLNWIPLSSGSFLHSCSPPIVHGNLTCDTIFIQHNGLIKIGSGLCELKHWACHYLTIIFLTFLNSCPRCYSPARQDLPRGNEKYPFYCSGIRKWV